MKIALKKIGNSRGFTIPSSILEELSWSEETPLELEIIDGALVVSKGIPLLDEMLHSVGKALPDPEGLSRKLRGKELRE